MKPVKPSRSHSRNGITAALLERASRAEGCCAADLPEWTRHQISNNACGLVLDGRLIQVGARDLRRWFTDRTAANGHAAQLPALRAKARAGKGEARQQKPASPWGQQQLAKKKPAAEAPVKVGEPAQKWKDRPVITPPHVKVQECPSPQHFGPAARLWGSK